MSHLIAWFPDGVEGRIEPGETVIFDFGKYGKSKVMIVDASPNTYFAYRWVPGLVSSSFDDITSRPTTLVEFRLEEVDGGTKVNLIESGFASLPAEEIAASFKDNSEGWAEMLPKLAKYVERG